MVVRPMAIHQQDSHTCPQCGAKVAPDRRYCVHCYSPVGRGATTAHAELTRDTATTHRHDPTLVFSPEKHEQIVRRARSRKRIAIAGIMALLIIVAGSI